jgi:signal peptidase I
MVVGQVAILAAVFGLVHPYLAEAYRIPNLAMAPTLLGEHRFVPCPHCGVLQPVETPSPFDNDPRLPLQETMYCPSCGTHWEATPQKVAGPIFSADRILVARFLTPTRWDLVTYEHGKDIFVKRLVGLPGERISITRDGRLLINGTAALPPAGAPATFPWPEQLAGFPMALVPDHAMTLGPTDYFFIGDSAPASFDSRFDGPVHAAALRGVVSARYWPLSRVKLFR